MVITVELAKIPAGPDWEKNLMPIATPGPHKKINEISVT